MLILCIANCVAMEENDPKIDTIKKQEKERVEQSDIVLYLSHPATWFGSGLAFLGSYCLFDKETARQSYQWLKEQYDAIPSGIKWLSAGLGALGCYTYWYYKKPQCVLEKRIDTLESRLESLLIVVEYLSGCKDDLLHRIASLEKTAEKTTITLESHNGLVARIELLEKTKLKNKTLKKDLKAYLEVLQSRVAALAPCHEEAVETIDMVPTRNSMTLEKGEKGQQPDNESIHRETLISFSNRLANLEKINGIRINQNSFGHAALLHQNRLDKMEQDIATIIKKAEEDRKIIQETKKIVCTRILSIQHDKREELIRRKALPSPNKNEDGQK